MAAPTRLFKYSDPKWADALANEGKIRIGTLYDFRREEDHGEERGDKEEGLRITETTPSLGVVTSKTAPPIIRRALSIPDGAGIDFGDTGGIVFRQEFPDVFVYCTCARYEPAVERTFGGACVEIFDVRGFFTAITRQLSKPDEFGIPFVTSAAIANHCDYGERHQVGRHVATYHPAFRKPKRYEHQAEVRAIWATPRTVIAPMNLTVTDLVRCCCRYH
jgi:hypothetical protein